MIAVVLGTRPEIIKLSPIIRELVRQNVEFHIIHSNQHYSADMDSVFFKELEIPKPKYNLNAGGLGRSETISKIIIKISKIYRSNKYTCVVVQGDTNTVLAASLASSFEKIPVVHIEAGLRSYDREMPEEINRIITDNISDILFCPTKNQTRILNAEDVKGNKFVVGNTIVDSVLQGLEISSNRNIENKYGDYALLTLHRPSNVDNKSVLKGLINAIENVSRQFKLKFVFPVHPRTEKALMDAKIVVNSDLIQLIKPVSFLEMINLEKHSKIVLTDSGGIQEEACILKVPCVTIRDNTERPETVSVGANVVAGIDSVCIVKSVEKMLKANRNWKNPFGDGNSSVLIVDKLKKIYEYEK